jgi:tetratricopeptide (TPR) repeat protein
VSKEKYRDASKKFMSADDITGNYKNAKTLASKYEAMADEKDAQICYDKGTAFVNTDNFRDASIQFNKAVSFMPNFKDAQALATKYKTIADENDAQICYNKGKTLVNVGNFRDAVIQFNKAVSFVSNFKDAKALATKYKNMADEKDAQAHYEKGQALMNQNEFKGAEKEFLSANNYVKGYKDALLLAEKARSAMPNEAQIASAVTAALQEGIPVSWVGNLLGGSNAKLNSIKVEKIGIYNDRERYWPMQIRVIGSCLLNDPFNQGKEVSFDNIGDFILFKDDYGEWKAKMKGGMIR